MDPSANLVERLPPIPKLSDYPIIVGVTVTIIGVSVLLAVARHFDHTGGPLAISMMVVVAFIGTAIFCVLFTVPTDEITSSVIGGLTASFGAVIAYWLGRPRDPPPPG